MCEDSWWEGKLTNKGKCMGDLHASTALKPNAYVQDSSLQWKRGNDNSSFKLKCADVCL